MDQTHRPELLEAAAQLERAKALLMEAPDDYETFESCLQAVVLELRRVSHSSREELLRFRDSLEGLNCLFHGAEAFYRGWSTIAAVSDSDPALPSICIRA